MHFAKLGAAVSLVQFGQAILLPPTISSADSEIVNTLPFEESAVVGGRQLDLSCPGCPVVFNDLQGQAHYTDTENVLRLEFSIAQGEESDRLVLNGVPIYPMEPLSEAFMQPLTAPQLIHTGDDWNLAAEPVLGYSLSVKHPVHSEQDQLDLVAIHIEIVEVANKFLNGIPAVEIKLLETPSGKLMLGDAEVVSAQTPTPSDGDQECTTVVCKWQAIIAAKLSKLKGCGSKARPEAAIDGGSPKDHGRPQPHVGRPRPHGHGGHFRHHHHRHNIGRFLRNIAMHVLLPILVGVAVGITASLVGMLVGNLVVLIWRALFRRGGQYTKVQQDEIIITEEDCDNESKGFLKAQGPPPTYESVDEKA